MTPELLTIAEAAAKFRASEAWVRPYLPELAKLRMIAVVAKGWPVTWRTLEQADPAIGVVESRWVDVSHSPVFEGTVCLEAADVGAIVAAGSSRVRRVRRRHEQYEPSFGELGVLADGQFPVVSRDDLRVFVSDVAQFRSAQGQVYPLLDKVADHKAAVQASKSNDALAAAVHMFAGMTERTSKAEEQARRQSEAPPSWALPSDIRHEDLAAVFNNNHAAHSSALEAAVRLWMANCLVLGADNDAAKQLTTKKLAGKLTQRFSVRIATNVMDIARVTLPDIARRSGRKTGSTHPKKSS